MSSSCPGFKPHGVKPTRCRRCFKEYNEHAEFKKPEPVGSRRSSLAKQASTEGESSSPFYSERRKSSVTDSSSALSSTSTARADSVTPTPDDPTSERRRLYQTSASSVSSTLRSEPDGADQKRLLSPQSSVSDSGRMRRKSSPRRVNVLAAQEVSRDDDDKSPDVEYIIRVKTQPQPDTDTEDASSVDESESAAESMSIPALKARIEWQQSKISSLENRLKEAESKGAEPKVTGTRNHDKCEKEKSDLEKKLKKAQQDLTAAERSLVESKKEATAAKESVAAAKKEAANAAKEAAAAAKQVEDAKKEAKELRDSLEGERRKRSMSEADRHALERSAEELIKLQKRIRELEAINEELRDDNEVLKLQIKETKSDVDKVKREAEKFKADLERVKSESERARSDSNKAKSDSEKVNSEISRLKAEADQYKSEANKIKSEYEKARNQADKAKAEADKVKNEINKMKTEAEKAKAEAEKFRTEAEKLKSEVNRLKSEAEKIKSDAIKTKTETTKAQNDTSHSDLQKIIKELRVKLEQSEALNEQLQEENDEIKKEVRTLETELEELHDNFREDQASEFRDLKKELESQAKNCRVLQFKLKKAERLVEQLELDKRNLGARIMSLEETQKIEVDKKKIKELEDQLTMAQEVSVNQHKEIEQLKEERVTLEAELTELRDKLRSDTPKSLTGFKASGASGAGGREGGPPRPPPSPSRLSPKPSLSPQVSFEDKYEAVVRDLYDTMEREKDVQEQLKFAEEETRTLRKKLSTMEQENEILMMQIRKMASKNKKLGKDEADEEEELNPEEMKLHLELYEQEVNVLRKKVDEIEQENENLQQEVKYLQEKLISQPMTRLPEIPDLPPDSPPNVIYEHKIKILEMEARELRKKMVDKEKENESLRTELDLHRRKASSKVMTRSRSLESPEQVDLKKQLALVEQEASILRQKIISMEQENEKLSQENRRLQLRINRKPPLTPADQIQIENLELKQRIEELELKCSSMRTELEKTRAAHDIQFTVTSPSRKNSASGLSDTEPELIASLKARIREKEETECQLHNKIANLEVEFSKVTREYKKLRDAINYKKRPPKFVRDSATRLELKDIIKELEDELNEAQTALKGKGTMMESVKEDAEEYKREVDKLNSELKALGTTCDELRREIERQKRIVEDERQKNADTESKLQSLASEKGTDLKKLESVRNLEKVNRELMRKTSELEDILERERKNAKEATEKANQLSKLKEDFSSSNKLLQTEKKRLEDELKTTKDRLRKTEEQLAQTNNKFERLEQDLNISQKTVSQLETELEEARGRIFALESRGGGDARATPTQQLTAKELAQYKREINEHKLRIDYLENQYEKQKRTYMEKEQALRDEYERRLRSVVDEHKSDADYEASMLKEERDALKNKYNDLKQKMTQIEVELRDAQDKYRQFDRDTRRETTELQSKIADQETQMRAELRKRERLERDHELQLKQKDAELLESRERQVQMERELRRLQQRLGSIESDYEVKMGSISRELSKSHAEYDDLTSKYEQLESEHVELKSRINTEKETLIEAINSLKRAHDEKVAELKSLRDNYNRKQEAWIKEKLDLQEKLTEMENKVRRIPFWEQERIRLKGLIDEKEAALDRMRKEERAIKEDRLKLQSKCEELQKKITELERNEKQLRARMATGAMTGGSATEAGELRHKLDHAEASHKGQVAALHKEYEGRMKLMGDEIDELQKQISALVHERDALRNQLELSLSGGDPLGRQARFKEELEDLRAQLNQTRDGLEQALLENRNMRISHAAEKSSWQIQEAELKTKCNQLDERILLETSRGTTRSYAKTKMELAWDRERQEQQKLLQETQKFINEMRDKIFTLETMRDKERQEARKQLQELKMIMDREQEDTQRRISELQLDLVDLRDAHAKLRSQNDRLRRQRDTLEREREDWRLKLFAAIDVQNKTNELMDELQTLWNLLPEDMQKKSTMDDGEKKDEGDEKKGQMKTTLQVPGQSALKPTPKKSVTSTATKIAADELKKVLDKVDEKVELVKQASVPLPDEERYKRQMSFRRAVSASDMAGYPQTPRSMRGAGSSGGGGGPGQMRAPPRMKGRKSVSLEQTAAGQGASQERIWDSEQDSANTTPNSSVTNLSVGRYSMGAGYYGRGYSGYDSETSLPDYYGRYGREGSYEGSDVSLPAMRLSAGRASGRALADRIKDAKKARSIGDSLSSDILPAFELSPLELKKQREKKESSLKHKISKTLRSLSRSSQALAPVSESSSPPSTSTSNLPSSLGQRSAHPAVPENSLSSSGKGGEKGSRKTLFGGMLDKFGGGVKKEDSSLSSSQPTPSRPQSAQSYAAQRYQGSNAPSSTTSSSTTTTSATTARGTLPGRYTRV